MQYDMPEVRIETIELTVASMTSSGFHITFAPAGAAYYLAKATLLWGTNGGAACTMKLKKHTTNAALNTAENGTTVIDVSSTLALSSGALTPTAFTLPVTAAVSKARRFKPGHILVGIMAGTVSPLADVRIQLKWVATR